MKYILSLLLLPIFSVAQQPETFEYKSLLKSGNTVVGVIIEKHVSVSGESGFIKMLVSDYYESEHSSKLYRKGIDKPEKVRVYFQNEIIIKFNSPLPLSLIKRDRTITVKYKGKMVDTYSYDSQKAIVSISDCQSNNYLNKRYDLVTGFYFERYL